MSLLLIEGTINQEMLNRLHGYTLAVQAGRRLGLLDAEKMLVKADVARSELHDKGRLSSIQIFGQLHKLF